MEDLLMVLTQFCLMVPAVKATSVFLIDLIARLFFLKGLHAQKGIPKKKDISMLREKNCLAN
jgi:hypothetical protein